MYELIDDIVTLIYFVTVSLYLSDLECLLLEFNLNTIYLEVQFKGLYNHW